MGKDTTETAIQMQYAIRQFEVAKVRASLSQAKALVASAKGDTKEAERWLGVVSNHIHTMDETNDFIDSCLREEAGREYALTQNRTKL